jgi:flagellar biosynthetic protein FliO
MHSRIRLAGPSTIGPMAHRGAPPAGLAGPVIGRIVARGMLLLPVGLRRRPKLVALAAIAVLITIGGRIAAMAPAGAAGSAGSTGDASALSLFDGPTAAQGGTSASLPLGSAAGSIDIVDLVVKGLLVIVLLYITLRVLRQFQTGGASAGSRIRVLESRTIGPKATIHLVAIGDRQLVVGLTPGRLVTLAELPADEIDGATADDLDVTLDMTGDGADTSITGRREPFAPIDDPSLTSTIARRIGGVLR